MLQELAGFHMEKAFTEREFATNYNFCVEKVSYKSLMGVQVFYEFPGQLYALLIEVVKFPVFSFLRYHLTRNMKIFYIHSM